MAYIDTGDGGGYEQPDYLYGNDQGITDPTTKSPSQPADPWAGKPESYSTVAGYYNSLLGRAPENTDVVANWLNGTQGHLDQIYSGIAGSPEAQAYKARATAQQTTQTQLGGGQTGYGDDASILSQIAQWAGMAGADPSLRNDPNYWLGRIKQTGGLNSGNMQYWQNASVGPTAFFNNPGRESGGVATTAGSYTGGANPGGYTDASSKMYLDQVLARLNQVQQPQDNSIFELLKTLATAQANKLQQAPYTPADDAALITQYRQPLTQARDTAKQQAALDMSRRNISPTSGVYQDRMKAIDVAYEGGIAQGANQMGVNAVQQKNANAMQSLQILSSLMGAQNTVTDRSNAMSDQAVTLAKMFPDFDATRLDQMLRASSDNGASSAISNLTSLGNLNLNTIGMNNGNDAANSAAWGKLIASILGAL